MDLKNILTKAVIDNASDVHLAAGSAPTMRVSGEIKFIGTETLTGESIHKLLSEVVPGDLMKVFDDTHELNISFTIDDVARFRLNACYERCVPGASIRVVSLRFRSLRELGLPPVVEELTTRPNGLVLITGAAGMGKTTTMAAMIDFINQHGKPSRVITIEDPIEYLHPHGKSVVIQREVGTDTVSFAEALRQAMRQDPNVICIGEMRDIETIATALTAAETGHLVFGTLHTQDAAQTIDRIIDVFPASQQDQVRVQLSTTLQGIISQRLLPRADSKGRALAVEILVANQAIRNIIRRMDPNQLYNSMSSGGDMGMVTMDKSLKRLVDDLAITHETAMEYVKSPKDFKFI